MPVDAYPFAPAAYQHKAIEGEEKERMKEKKKKRLLATRPGRPPAVSVHPRLLTAGSLAGNGSGLESTAFFLSWPGLAAR